LLIVTKSRKQEAIMMFVVLPATIPEIRQCYDVYFEAFKHSVVRRILFPGDIEGEEFRAGHAAHTLEHWHKDNAQYTCKCVDTDTNEIIGMALWDVFPKNRMGGASIPAVDWLEGEDKKRAEALLAPVTEHKRMLLGPSQHLCECLKSALVSSKGVTDRTQIVRSSLSGLSTSAEVLERS
jgi:hypothetical protein